MADYREQKLVNNKGNYRDMSRHLLRYRKKIDVQMRPHVLIGSGTIAVFELPGKYEGRFQP